jgi:hypothetical protein
MNKLIDLYGHHLYTFYVSIPTNTNSHPYIFLTRDDVVDGSVPFLDKNNTRVTVRARGKTKLDAMAKLYAKMYDMYDLSRNGNIKKNRPSLPKPVDIPVAPIKVIYSQANNNK